MSRRIIVHSLDHAAAAVAAAAALGLPVTVMSAPGAGAYAGASWWRALVEAAAAAHPGAALSAVLDCGDEAGVVLAGLRAGLRHLRFSGAQDMRARLAALATQSGAQIDGDAPLTSLDLLGQRDPEAACRAFLAAGGTGLAAGGTGG